LSVSPETDICSKSKAGTSDLFGEGAARSSEPELDWAREADSGYLKMLILGAGIAIIDFGLTGIILRLSTFSGLISSTDRFMNSVF
jgi:hypothetical protein